tara:strand:+ start:758 stop:1228 length:471 start_codon:yes stop_codon:yes gene_type:complete
MDIPIPQPIFDVDKWFKSTFTFDGHGNIVLSSRYKIYYYQLEKIIKIIGNSHGDNILKHIKEVINDCTLTQDITGGYKYSKINRIQIKGSKSDREILETFHILESDFNKFSSLGTWHEKLKEHKKDPLLYLAWENECLRKKVEELDNRLKSLVNIA